MLATEKSVARELSRGRSNSIEDVGRQVATLLNIALLSIALLNIALLSRTLLSRTLLSRTLPRVGRFKVAQPAKKPTRPASGSQFLPSGSSPSGLLRQVFSSGSSPPGLLRQVFPVNGPVAGPMADLVAASKDDKGRSPVRQSVPRSVR